MLDLFRCSNPPLHTQVVAGMNYQIVASFDCPDISSNVEVGAGAVLCCNMLGCAAVRWRVP